MTNAVKHASPSRIEITLSDAERLLTVNVDDDGFGFDPRQAGDGLGLVSIRDRIETLGGEVQFESAVGAGTRVSARIPILERGSIPHVA